VVRSAAAARRDAEFAIIARTDAKGAGGLDEVIRRLNLYVDNGADLAMLGDFYTRAEYEKIVREVRAPVVACASDPDHFAQQPDFTVDEWKAMGVKMVVYWYLPLFAALKAVRRAVTALANEGSTAGLGDEIATYREYAEALELERWLQIGEGDL
jgi:methylisocitrate lyase